MAQKSLEQMEALAINPTCGFWHSYKFTLKSKFFALAMLKHAWEACIWCSDELVYIGFHGLS